MLLPHKKFVVSPLKSIKDALEIINSGGLRFAIVAANDILVGTISDGDVRRAILNNIELDVACSSIMNRTPIKALEKSSTASRFNLMRKNNLEFLPVVNAEDRLVGIEILETGKGQPELFNPVVIVAGGFGKRLWPLTKDTPKPMIEVGGKPILEHILLRCIKLGFKNFYISTFFKSEIIEGFFEDGSKWGVNIRYLKENEPLGTAGCLSLLPRSEIKHDILMLNGDVLNEVDYISLLNFHRGSSNSATICTRNYQVSIPFGVVEQNGEGRLQVFEKPSVVRQINTGIYIFSPSVLAFLEPETYVTSPELLNKLSDNGFKIDVFPIHEYWADIGQHDQLNQAIQDWEK